ncbi:MAG: T9SS type A sorting domain-containing protein [Lewinellaceae bacterium]|nr:T9SS type A sorting domain-containing protein [Lewinellaceae bacterium]
MLGPEGLETIDISSLTSGLYFVSVQQNESVQQTKIVKH